MAAATGAGAVAGVADGTPDMPATAGRGQRGQCTTSPRACAATTDVGGTATTTARRPQRKGGCGGRRRQAVGRPSRARREGSRRHEQSSVVSASLGNAHTPSWSDVAWNGGRGACSRKAVPPAAASRARRRPSAQTGMAVGVGLPDSPVTSCWHTLLRRCGDGPPQTSACTSWCKMAIPVSRTVLLFSKLLTFRTMLKSRDQGAVDTVLAVF